MTREVMHMFILRHVREVVMYCSGGSRAELKTASSSNHNTLTVLPFQVINQSISIVFNVLGTNRGPTDNQSIQ